MYADDEFAVAAISTSTLASILTYLAWLMAVGPKVLCFGLVDLVIENNHGS
jgi:hypothetical protein